MTLSIERLQLSHSTQFLTAVARSETLHSEWVSPPKTPGAIRDYLENGDRNVSYVAVHDDSSLVGCIRFSEIVGGPFQSGFLSFYAFSPFDGKGLMKEAMKLVLREAFTTHRLHRLEANIQPTNERSKRFVQSLGFRHEGYSPRYLYIGGQWRDHDRYAITAEEWDV